MTDGTRLRESWYKALADAEDYFRRLLKSSASPEWKRVVVTSDSSSIKSKGKGRASATPELTDVIVHRKSDKSGDFVYRAVLDVPTGEEPVNLEPWRSVLVTPELRQEWDPAVEGAHLVEMFDPATRVAKTNFTLGWPANPRDAVTISRTFNDTTTLMDISTSLPRSADEPAYLRPSPPYVRSSVKLFAWCIQHVQPPSPQPSPITKGDFASRIRITCFWQHDLRSVWNFGSSSGVSQQLGSMVLGLYKTVQNRGARIPLLIGYGNGVSIERIRFDIGREALTVDYSIVPEDEDHSLNPDQQSPALDLHTIREHRRLTRSIECALPSSRGWDIQLSTKASSEKVAQLPWTTRVIRHPVNTSPRENEKYHFNVKHNPLPDDHSVLKVKVIIELSGPSGVRLNGLPQAIEEIQERDPTSYFMSQQILQDATSNADLSFHTASSVTSVESVASSSRTPQRPILSRTPTERTAGADKAILSQVRRKYIYFSSLLQEPEAKWKRTTEARGVEITQLDSIDPTLVVYRAEATFVGVGLWDLYGAIVTPGARGYWDKLYEDSILLEDVNELSELWHIKTKPAWPVNGRDSVLLRTVYKSPSTIHVFAFSADNLHLFPSVPPVEPNVIRAQVDLQGWSIESLSPTTTLVTLLEQSDPKGWSNKASIPQHMITAVAGVGEFAIKCGGPPAATRLAGAQANDIRYDHERGSFRIEYKSSANRRTTPISGSPTSTSTTSSIEAANGDASSTSLTPFIECEVRCDIDTWASSLDIVIDPPPQSVSCLRRHRLSSGGGGLWLTISHDAVFAGDERILAIIRKGPGREKGLVMVNGSKVTVDVEDMPEHEAKSLTKRKRVKPVRIPLDQPPVLGVIRRRRAEWDADADSSADNSDAGSINGKDATASGDKPTSPTNATFVSPSAPKYSSPLTKFFTMAYEQATTTTQQAVAAISPATVAGNDAVPSASKPPMQHALDALAYVQQYYSRSLSEGWTLVSEKGFPVHRKLVPEISPTIPIHKGEKVIEGVSAEEIASVVANYSCRKQWDDRFDSASILQEYGARCHTAFVVTKGGFPFRDRGFYLASLVTRTRPRPPSAPALSRRNSGEAEQDNRATIFVVSASFNPESVASFSPTKYNSYALPIGRVFVDAWILETLDPYTEENFTIPSTRCTRIVASDYAGSIPAAVNSMINGLLPRSILAVEAYMKGLSPIPCTRLPASSLFFVEEAKEDALVGNDWNLRRRDDNRLLVTTTYSPTERTYRNTILITFPTSPSSAPQRPEDLTPRPSRLASKSISISNPAESRDTLRPNSPSKWSESPRRATMSPSSPSQRSRSRDALRSSSSAFTLRGEVRQPSDFLLAEIVVDSKLYPGGYDVQLKSVLKDSKKQHIPLSLTRDELTSESENFLPVAHAVHAIPSSPLHSSGLNAERPPQHLLRLTLPTSQYDVSTVYDPLTDETHTAPPKPQWLLDLEEKGAILDIQIRPSSSGKKDEMVVHVNGTVTKVTSEKESLTTLGRDDIQNTRVSKMALLSRTIDAPDPIPEELRSPIAIAEHLLEPAALESVTNTPAPDLDPKEEASVNSENTQDTGNAATSPQGSPQPEVQAPTTPSSTGFLSFLNAYPNPLLRFTSGPSPRLPALPKMPSSSSLRETRTLPLGGLTDLDSHAASVDVVHVPAARSYPLSAVIVVALIAFLVGSLLRSLISPADFIHVVTDFKEVDETTTGWREIKRLVEIKYLIGGWDFQIAVVRRH
ncbi:hypothetical protein JAAARDRAFT_31325 [Jaapia argillacea MUCL 33604]|uniref:START domain-containing protein n=1 Tax=Jaapia argillacea MUCL 33604 TaxID=933084 RepID=A0A067QGW3_9AGAM|nr:hypothetical protein JAAARDRAFT_31325 [Jaapia argillacea MUCL 33604]